MWSETFTGELPEETIVILAGQYRLVEVQWIDAACDSDLLPIESEVKPLMRATIGYLLAEHEDYLEMTFGLVENLHKGIHACEMKFALPKCMVLSIRDLT